MKTLLCFALSIVACLSSATWSTFHGNNRRDGRTTAIVPANATQRWACDLKGPMLAGPVIGPDGTIYILNQDESKNSKNCLNAVRPYGTIRWRYELPWIDDMTLATPAVGADGRIYGGTATGFFFCVDAAGVLAWSLQTSKPIIHHTLVGSNGTIYTVLNQKLTAISPSGTILWQDELDENYEGGATEGLDGSIYMVGSDGLRCYTPTGTRRWTAFAGRTLAPVAIAPNGSVITFGTWAQAFNPVDGTLLWSGSTYAYGSYATPSIDSTGNIYYGSDYNLFKVSNTGTTLFDGTLYDPGSNYLGHTWASSVIDGSGKVYFSLGNGKRSAIPFEKKVLILNSSMAYFGGFTLPEIPGTSVPAIGDNGRMYVGCLDGKLYCFGL